MIAIIKGDIVDSRKLINQDIWLIPLKKLLSKWGNSPLQWEIIWGDSFQIEIPQPEEALKKSLLIKALLKKITLDDTEEKKGTLDVRMSIGIGEKTYFSTKISESNGPAFFNAGDQFDELKKENVNLAIKSPWHDFDKEINLYLKLAGTFMDHWSISSAELLEIVLENPTTTQVEIGKKLGIKQNSVSGRWNRAHVSEILAVDQMYRHKLLKLIQ
jgi:hypothetical protein